MGFNKYFSEKHYSANCFFSEFTFLYLIYTLKFTPFASFCTNCCLSFCLISVLNSHTLRVSLSFCLYFCHVCLNLTFLCMPCLSCFRIFVIRAKSDEVQWTWPWLDVAKNAKKRKQILRLVFLYFWSYCHIFSLLF